MDRGRKAATDQAAGSATSLSYDFVVGKVLRETPLTDSEPMNTRSFGSRRERAIFHPYNATTRVAGVGFAASFARLFGMRGAGNVRTFAANKSGALLGFGLFGRGAACSEQPQFHPRSFGSLVFSELRQHLGMTARQMFGRGQALKVFNPIVRFVSVDVVHLLVGVKPFHPACCYSSVNQHLTAHAQVTPVMLRRSVRQVLSENFSAARNGVKVVKSAVLDAAHRKANHVVPPPVTNKISFTTV